MYFTALTIESAFRMDSGLIPHGRHVGDRDLNITPVPQDSGTMGGHGLTLFDGWSSSVRAPVESFSLLCLNPLYGFEIGEGKKAEGAAVPGAGGAVVEAGRGARLRSAHGRISDCRGTLTTFAGLNLFQ